MKGYDLLPYSFNKAFVHPEYQKDGEIVIGPHICINTKGEKLFELPDKEMIPSGFDDEDVCVVNFYDNSSNKYKSSLINSKGEFLTDFMEENIFNYDEKYKIYTICGKSGYGIINSKGKIIIPPIYKEEISFYDGIATVQKSDLAGAFNLDGNIIIPFEYKKLGIYSDGLICAKKQDRTTGYIDKNNNVVIPFGKYICNSNFNSNVAIVFEKQEGQIYIDKKGNQIELKL